MDRPPVGQRAEESGPSPRPLPRGRRSRRARVALAVLLGFASILLGIVAWPYRGPLFIAAILAAAFQPALRRASGLLGGHRRIAGGLLTLLVLLLVIGPLAAVAGFATRQVLAGLAFLRDTLGVHRVSDLAHAQIPSGAQALLDRGLALAHVSRGQLAAYTDRALSWAQHAAPSFLAASGEALVHTVVLLGAFYFLLLDGRRAVEWLVNVSPLRRAQTRQLIEEFRRVAVATLFGTVAAAVFQGLAAGAGYAIFRVPHPVFFGLITGIASFVPAVGTLTVWVPASLLLVATGHLGAGIGLAAWCLVTVVGAEHFGKPLLMGSSAEMHTGLVFLGLLGGIEMFGLIGVLAGPLVVAFFLALARMSERELAGVPAAGSRH